MVNLLHPVLRILYDILELFDGINQHSFEIDCGPTVLVFVYALRYEWTVHTILTTSLCTDLSPGQEEIVNKQY